MIFIGRINNEKLIVAMGLAFIINNTITFSILERIKDALNTLLS
jgi:hypothetical protein